jgi:hypothetical protein
MLPRLLLPLSLGALAAGPCALALAQTPPTPTAPGPARLPHEPIAASAEAAPQARPRASVTLAGYVESFYQWNFNNPSNGITNFRGYDNRHNTFTLENVVLDTSWSLGAPRISGRFVLQFGLTPETEYLDEPVHRGTISVGPSDINVWKYLQLAFVGWHAPIGRTLLVEAGLFLSPVGPEGMAVKDQWNWSRSNLFFGLPFYHTGARATYPLTDRWNVSVGVYNGWNSVVDNNVEKSVAAQLTYTIQDRVTFDLLYFGGVERPTGAPEGRAWRNLLDCYLTLYPTRRLSLMVHVDAGIEPNHFGISWWAAGALALRVQPLSWLYLAARADFFYEHRAHNEHGTAAFISFPVPWVSEQTVTVDVRPFDLLSFRLEFRHDQAAEALYFRDQVRVSPLTQQFIPNAEAQNNLTVGVVSWF